MAATVLTFGRVGGRALVAPAVGDPELASALEQALGSLAIAEADVVALPLPVSVRDPEGVAFVKERRRLLAELVAGVREALTVDLEALGEP